MDYRADVRAAIGEAIVVLRRRAKLKAYELAHLAEMDKSQLSGYELAKKWVRLPVLLRITTALGMTLAEFFTFAQEQAKSRQAGQDPPYESVPASDRAPERLEMVAQRSDPTEYAEDSRGEGSDETGGSELGDAREEPEAEG